MTLIHENLVPGEKVIVRSCDDEPIRIGIFTGFAPVVTNLIPTVFIDGEEFIVTGKIARYSVELEKELSGMSRQEQWDHLKK